MLKFFYRLKRKGGVVLFAVIAVMTLLIAMATTAYFTARMSYQTVVSNYDFSQLYLSTTSLSDMIIGALTQSTSRSDVTGSDGKKLNDYSVLKSQVLGLKAAGTVGKYIEGYSSNIYASKSKSESEILSAAASDPVEAGVIDGLKVKISLDKIEDQIGADGSKTGKKWYYFTVTTTGFYRNNVVTVQDSVYNLAGTTTTTSKNPSFDTFFKNTGGSSADPKGERAVIIATQEISDNAYFENTYTIFTEISGGNNEFNGGITATGSVFFKGQAHFHIPKPGTVWDKSGNQTTMANARHDWFINGDLGLFANNTDNLNLNGNNLYVNGNLIIANAQGISANNIYVTGNIYVLNQGATITIQDKNGNTDKTAGAVYCGGSVYYSGDIMAEGKGGADFPVHDKDDGTSSSGFINKYGSAWTTIQDEYNFVMGKVTDACAEVGGTDQGKAWSVCDGEGIKGRFSDDNFTLKVNGEISDSMSSLNDKGDYDPKSTTVDYSTLKSSGNTYVYESQSSTIQALFDSESGVTKPNDWTTYTAKEQTLKNLLSIDVSKFPAGNTNDGWTFPKDEKTGVITGPAVVEIKDADGKLIAKATKTKDGDAVYYFYSACDTGKTNPSTVTWSKTGENVIVDIQFDKRGYTLDLASASEFYKWCMNGDRNLTYNIHTYEEIETGSTGNEYTGTMPIVLLANCFDNAATKTDGKGNNAFSWTGTHIDYKGDTVTGANAITFVNIVNKDGSGSAGKVESGKASAGGNVIFEMGNIDKSGNYVQAFDTGSSTSTTFTIVKTEPDGTGKKFVTASVTKGDEYAATDAVTYHAGSHDLVGTLAQTTEIAKAGKDKYQDINDSNCKIKNLYVTTGNKSDVQPKYENRIMLISSKKTGGVGSGRLAYSSDSDIELFCGYIYAPDGLYGNGYGNQKVPIFGGLIVSEMVASMATYEYAEPDPTIIQQMLDGLGSKGGTSKTTGSTEGEWFFEGANIGRNYVG